MSLHYLEICIVIDKNLSCDGILHYKFTIQFAGERIFTRSSAIAEGPRDASCHLKSCQLPRNSAETTCTTSPEQIEVKKLEGYSGPCVVFLAYVHLALFLALSFSPGNSLVSSWCDHSMLGSLL